MKKPAIIVPEGCKEVLLHACCAPCSSAIVAWLVQHDVRPTIFYYNPNIFPLEEYEIRKNESKRHAESLGLTWIDGDYNHEQWRQDVCGLEGEPERGRRCEQCFTLRLTVAAHKAKELGLQYFTTTLASSRWKSLEQIERAGHLAEQAVEGTTFWAQNWVSSYINPDILRDRLMDDKSPEEVADIVKYLCEKSNTPDNYSGIFVE